MEITKLFSVNGSSVCCIIQKLETHGNVENKPKSQNKNDPDCKGPMTVAGVMLCGWITGTLTGQWF